MNIIETGYGEDILGQSTVKYRILERLENGDFRVERFMIMTSYYGNPYYAVCPGPKRVISKLWDIHTEEIPNEG